jgi:hypothetical protein
MIDSLKPEVWAYLMLGMIVASTFYAWAADAILGRIGFGVMITTVIVEGTAYGSLMGMDWAVAHRKIPYQYDTPLGYAGAAFIGATLTLFFLCFIKQLLRR